MKEQLTKSPLAAEIHARMTDLLKREVILMREILANMCEEEIAFIDKDPVILQEVMSKRDAPLQMLKDVREERCKQMDELISLLDPKGFSRNTDSLIALMEAKGLESIEFMVLQDQIIALIDKMNLQNTSNEHLREEASPLWKEMMSGSLLADHESVSLLHAVKEKRKLPQLGLMNPTNTPHPEN